MAAAIIVALLSWPVPAGAQEVRGRVFLDRNGNTRFDDGEAGLADVPITDGVGFVRTDAQGRYALRPRRHELLRETDDPIITVSFPSGTWPAAGWMRRIGRAIVAGRVDFPLRPDKQPLPFAFIHATDPHVPRAGRQRFDDFRRDMGLLADAGLARFCILTGDCVDMANMHGPEKAQAEWKLFAELVQGFPLPLFCTPGNHDPSGVNCLTGWDRDDPAYGYGPFWHVAGPLRWSFNYAGVHLVGIDYMQRAGKAWAWGVPPSAIEWLAEDLRLAPPDARVLLFVHYTLPAAGLEDLLRKHRVACIFAGHTHLVAEDEFAGIPRVVTGSVSRPFPGPRSGPGYRLVRVDANTVATFYQRTGMGVEIDIDDPRPGAPIDRTGLVRGRLSHPQIPIHAATVQLDRARAEATIRPGLLFSDFQATVDLSKVRPGLRELVVTATDGRQTWSARRRCLIGLPDRAKPPDAATPATLLGSAPSAPDGR